MALQIKSKIKQYIHEGFFHIFGSGVLAKLGGIISSIVVVRNLPKSEYGNFVEADNLYSYFAIFIGLGISTSIIQYCSENVSEDKKNAIYRFSVKIGFWGNFILLPLILVAAVIKYYTGAVLEAFYLAILCILPFITFIDHYHQYVLRSKLDNKGFGYTNIVHTIAHVCGNILFTLRFGVVGLIFSQYLAHALSAIYSYFILRKSSFYSNVVTNTTPLTRDFKKEFLSYSVVSALTTFASAALTLLDVSCLGILLNDAEVLADYKVAMTVPTALLFVPKSFMTYYFPRLVRAFSLNRKNGIKEVVQYTAVNILINGLICICLLAFAPLLIKVLYGEKYMNVVPVFRILGINFFFSALKLVTGHVIIAMKRVKVNLLFTIISGIVNIGINFMLIPVLGYSGAAVATLIVSVGMFIVNIIYLGLFFRKNGSCSAL